MGSEHSLSLYEGLSGTSSPRQTAKVGIEQRASSQSVLTFLEGFQRLWRFPAHWQPVPHACPFPECWDVGEHREPIAGIGKKLNVTPLVCQLSVWMHLVSLWWGSFWLAGHAYDLISHYNVFVDFGTAFLWTLAPVFPLQKCGLHLPVPCFSFLSAGHALIIFSWTLSETTGLVLCVGLLGGAAV